MIPGGLPDGSMKLNESYQEILRLDQILFDAGIPHELVRVLDGWQLWYPSKKEVVADVIQHFGSYGHDDNLLEIMGLLTPEEEEHDSVLGYLTAMEVYERIVKHYLSEHSKGVSKNA